MADPAGVIADAIQDVLDVEPQSLAVRAASAVLAALRAEYGVWRIPAGYLRTDGSEVDGTDVVIPVPVEATDG